MRQMILDIRPDAQPTLDTYLPGANTEVVQALRGIAAGQPPERIFYLWGPAGVGKTHLLRALRAACHATGRRSLYVPAVTHLPEELDGVLAVDDVGGLQAEAQVRLFDLINAAREGRGVVVASGELPPARLSLRADLATRLSWGLVYALSPLSDADKLAAMVERGDAHGMRLPVDVAEYMLRHCRRDLPHLLALVDALDAYSLSLRRPVTVPLLRSLLADHVSA